jgi:hypothetical protein
MGQHNRLHNVWCILIGNWFGLFRRFVLPVMLPAEEPYNVPHSRGGAADKTMRKMSIRKLIPSLQPRIQPAVRLYRVCDLPAAAATESPAAAYRGG